MDAFSDRNSAPKKRPNENCVDMMIARNMSARMTIIDPVRVRSIRRSRSASELADVAAGTE